MSEVTDERIAELTAQAASLEARIAVAQQWREPSKAFVLGPGNRPGALVADAMGRVTSGDDAGAGGEWATALFNAGSRDAELQAIGKASLAELGCRYVPAGTKATLGDTDATGGFIVPNNIVAELEKTANYLNPFRNLLTVRAGVGGQAVDIPYRALDTTAAAIHVPGQVKENKDLTYSNYTATMYTLARIYDLGNAFLRQSAGAAQADVLSELGRAFALGESHYIVNGTGTGEPFGIIPALADAAPTFDSTFTGAATLAGSVAAAIATAAGDLSKRNQVATAAVMNGADYWKMFTQGADTAGFYVSNMAKGPLEIDPSASISVWGVPIYPDNNVPSDTLIIGNFRAATLFIGRGYRVETSSVAGTRWDKNETGFRGELDLAFDARPAVAVGAFQRITNLIP